MTPCRAAFGQAALAAVIVAAMVVGQAFFLSLPALSQTSEGAALGERLERLQRDVILLQRQIYSQGTESVSKAGSAKGGEATVTTALAGDDKATKRLAIRVETRMNVLEDEIRKMTGRAEEMSFKLGEIDDRLNLLLSDMGLRIEALEKKLTSGAAQPGSANLSQDTGGEQGGAAGDASFGDTTQVLGVLKTPVNEGEEQGVEGSGETAVLTEERPAPAILPEGSPEEQYEFALGKLWQSDYLGAEKALQAFLEVHGTHELAGNAKYWLGETYYVRKDYANAAVIFAEGFEKYPAGAKAADNLLKLGLSLANIDETDQACKAFLELGKRFPDAPSGIINRVAKERKQIGCK